MHVHNRLLHQMSVESFGGGVKGGQRSPRAAIESKHCHSGKEINMLILGKQNVGKTALTVRYLTKRFIGDYNSDLEMLYSHCTNVDGKHLTLHIIDTQGQTSKTEVSAEQVRWADSVLVVYAFNDKSSFDIARDIVEYVHSICETSQTAISLVANKCDLVERKTVSDTDLSRLCAEFNLLFFETSASESGASVVEVFTAIARHVRQMAKKREKLTRFMSNPAVAAKLQIQQSFRHLAERAWRSRTSTL